MLNIKNFPGKRITFIETVGILLTSHSLFNTGHLGPDLGPDPELPWGLTVMSRAEGC